MVGVEDDRFKKLLISFTDKVLIRRDNQRQVVQNALRRLNQMKDQKSVTLLRNDSHTFGNIW